MLEVEQKLIELDQKMNRHRHETIDGTSLVNKTSFITVSLPDTQSQTASNYGLIFVATRPCAIKAISEVHTTAGSSTPTLQVERLTGTTALGAGSLVLETAFDLAGTANTVQRGEIIPTGNVVGLSLGDRLALRVSGTLTSLKGVCVTIELKFT